MNDDRHRREYYGDPQKVLEYQSSYKAGCRGCVNDYRDKLKGWKCRENMPNYPNETRDTCVKWMCKGKK